MSAMGWAFQRIIDIIRWARVSQPKFTVLLGIRGAEKGNQEGLSAIRGDLAKSRVVQRSRPSLPNDPTSQIQPHSP
ncbi:hypothetical protein H5410_014847 [Solanum commersonii]|uniref:Uncharacterized protein n=1 Tax=Solanum commersonii TaxID=4109 RepID=A0A9J5ZSN7_SOLCO|nr:hypothetical protein H5410_014847 [Solanum commersonii]